MLDAVTTIIPNMHFVGDGWENWMTEAGYISGATEARRRTAS